MEASDRVLKFVDLADMLKRPALSPEAKEWRERGYRRGYRDGWIMCIETFEKALSDDANDAGYLFWRQELLAWMHEPVDITIMPPELRYKRPRKLRKKHS